MSPYDVFISYRRDGGAETARLLRMALNQEGYRVFLDVDDLSSGHFDERLLQDIERARHFVVILTPESLARVHDRQDWLRRELEHALQTGRNIVPLLMPGFQFPPPDALPESLRELARYHAVVYRHEYFDAAVARMVRGMPRGDEASSPASPPAPTPPPPPEVVAHANADNYGAFTLEPKTGYLVFGLLTAWGYVAMQLGARLVSHLRRRERYFLQRRDAAGGARLAEDQTGFAALAERAFRVDARWPVRFALGLALTGLYTLGIFAYFFVLQDATEQFTEPVLVLLGVASTLFFSLLLGFTLWFVGVLRRHERHERLLLRWFDERGVTPDSLPEASFASRWDRQDQHVALFGILGAPITYSPVLAAWYVLHEGAAPWGVLVVPGGVFMLAGLYHLWGIWLLLGIWNAHLRTERR